MFVEQNLLMVHDRNSFGAQMLTININLDFLIDVTLDFKTAADQEHVSVN